MVPWKKCSNWTNVLSWKIMKKSGIKLTYWLCKSKSTYSIRDCEQQLFLKLEAWEFSLLKLEAFAQLLSSQDYFCDTLMQDIVFLRIEHDHELDVLILTQYFFLSFYANRCFLSTTKVKWKQNRQSKCHFRLSEREKCHTCHINKMANVESTFL